jgi:hypothetical protein
MRPAKTRKAEEKEEEAKEEEAKVLDCSVGIFLFLHYSCPVGFAKNKKLYEKV